MRHTLQDIKDKYMSVFYLEETMIIDCIIGVCIYSKLAGDPIWLLLIGGPSSGKSELVNILSKVPFVHPISSLSENTFLSNMKLGNGKESSLLHRIGTSGMITQKDYTSILSMREQTRDAIIGQMREIFDGELTKEAGNGNSQKWKGKVNWLGAVTESVYLAEDESAGMGRRTINYIMPKQDRRKTTMRALQNNSNIQVLREEIQTMVAEFVEDYLNEMPKELKDLPEDFTNNIIDLSDFITLVRTPTSRNYKGELILVPSPEMPMRVFSMFAKLAKIIAHMHGDKITPELRNIIYRLAFDSIPKQTMMVLQLMTQYGRVTKKGCAHKLRYPTDTVGKWLENVNVLGVCERESGANSDYWVMNQGYRDIMSQFTGIEQTAKTLDHVENDEEGTDDWVNKNPTDRKVVNDSLFGTDDPGQMKENEERAQRDWDSFGN